MNLIIAPVFSIFSFGIRFVIYSLLFGKQIKEPDNTLSKIFLVPHHFSFI